MCDHIYREYAVQFLHTSINKAYPFQSHRGLERLPADSRVTNQHDLNVPTQEEHAELNRQRMHQKATATRQVSKITSHQEFSQ